MHDTALQIGGLALEIYANHASPEILDLGSYDINGALRQFASPSARYVGVDIEAGPGVDIVFTPGAPLPFEDGTFDMVMASSVFEHDPAFWLTFLEMCRKTRLGGYIYFNAPSNGIVHRYPTDNWRFYPDCGNALVKWAASQDVDVELVESFTAERVSDIWNDFIAVFRRLPSSGPLPDRSLHTEVPCYNIITSLSGELAEPRYETQDMTLLQQARTDLELFQLSNFELSNEQTETRNKHADIARMYDSVLQSKILLEADVKRIQNAREHAKSLLEEMHKTAAEDRKAFEQHIAMLEARESAVLSDLMQARDQIDEFTNKVSSLHDQIKELELADLSNRRTISAKSLSIAKFQKDEKMNTKALVASEMALAKLQLEFETQQRNQTELQMKLEDKEKELQQARADLATLQVRLQERSREVGTLSMRMNTLERELQKITADLQWHSEVGAILSTGLSGQWSILPAKIQQKKIEKRLLRARLFDSDAYLRKYPDVRSSGMSAITHYIRHGRKENRSA